MSYLSTRRVKRSLSYLAAITLACLAVSGCSEGTGPREAMYPAAGTYSLAEYNGAAIPATIVQNEEGRILMTSATMVLREDRSYSETRNIKIILTTGEEATNAQRETGTYTVTGNEIAFTFPGNNEHPSAFYVGTVSGNDLTYVIGEKTYHYKR